MFQGDSYREVFANPGFRALWLAQSLARLGQSIAHVAIALYVYELTGSARALSFAIALQLLPYVVIGPLAGLLADRLERKLILVGAYAVQAGLVACLPFTVTLGHMYLLVFLSSLLGPVAELVRAAALPSVTGQELFVRGSSLDIVAFNAVNVIGPPLGGVLVSAIGAKQTFWVVVGCLLAAVVFAAQAYIPTRMVGCGERSGHGPIAGDFRAGLGFLFNQPTLRFLLLLACISSLGWSAPEMAAMVYLTDVLHLGGQAYGLLRGTVSLSMALGVYILGRHSRTLPQAHLLVGGVVVAGLAYMAAAAQPRLVTLLGLWFIAGAGWSANWLMDNALWARMTPDELRGRVYSIAGSIVSLAEAGLALLGGYLIGILGPARGLFLIGGAIAVGAIVSSALSAGYSSIDNHFERSGKSRSKDSQ